MSTYSQIQKNISDYYKFLREQYTAKYVKEFLLGAGILVGLFGGYFLHGYYIKRREAKAFGALYEVVESFEKTKYTTMSADPVKDKEKIDNAWQDTEMLLDALYKDHMGSYLAPYFLIFKSVIVQEKGGHVDEARKILEDALVQMSKKSVLFDLFELKRIKMSFDSEDESVRKLALQDLIDFSKNNESALFEEALYTLGSYYIYQGDMVKAKEALEKLVKNADKKALLKSPWVKQAEEKLESLR